MDEQNYKIRLARPVRDWYYKFKKEIYKECVFICPDSDYKNGMKLLYYPNEKNIKVSYNSLYLALTSLEDRIFLQTKEIEVCKYLLDFNQIKIIKYINKKNTDIAKDEYLLSEIDQHKTQNICFLVLDNYYVLYIPFSSGKRNNYIEYTITDKQYIDIINAYMDYSDFYNFSFPSFDEITDSISSIIDYVTKYDFNEVAETYKVIENGYFLYHAGKDDSFNIDRKKFIDTEDEYVKSLFPLDEERTYYGCCGQGTDEDYWGLLRDDLINEAIDKANNVYTKSKHYTYFIIKFFKDNYEKKAKYDRLQSIIDRLFNYDIVCKDLYWMRYGTVEHWVIEYNESHLYVDDKVIVDDSMVVLDENGVANIELNVDDEFYNDEF